MNTAADAYFAWSQPGHHQGCKRPVWEVDTRIDHDAWHHRGGGGDHSCPNEDCGHANDYSALSIRLVCRCCEAVYLYRGEFEATAATTTRRTGFGQAPRRVGGIWLYPGPPLLHDDSEPYEYLCALRRVDRLQPTDVVGCLGQRQGRRGAVLWTAGALPELRDSRSNSRPFLSYTVLTGDVAFRTTTAAAKWVLKQVQAAQPDALDEPATGR
jgi:hypothetical protein